ncbi:helix-turn-helix domain-containing protein [Qipengyuania soli]|uniref:AraC family transcriptional regulator n=1 Tax=Qipengyuania soli TaxID=2782568 RepID=A0A7S8F1R9_9SPHN|nr:helix-turn-helix domain-containing protein [Qipengyuania soli]QPC98585.1 AraC family transcriptional regulator [Qipengyuania soli]
MALRLPRISEFASDQLSMLVFDTPVDLAPYLSGYYCTRIAPGMVLEDWMSPEEANLRCGVAELYRASIGPGELKEIPPVILSGSTDKATHVRVSTGEYWGVGLTPAGWARFIGMNANEFANRNDDLANYPELGELYRMFGTVVSGALDEAQVIQLLNTTFRALLGERPAHESTIHAVHLAIGSGRVTSSSHLASLAGMNQRTFERFCNRHFGFPPAALLRRQRFLRSLGRYMLDPSMRWINSLDHGYSDQAHFIREFRSVMGMTPGQYADRPHPLVEAAVRVTSKAAGVAMQALHTPKPALLR